MFSLFAVLLLRIYETEIKLLSHFIMCCFYYIPCRPISLYKYWKVIYTVVYWLKNWAYSKPILRRPSLVLLVSSSVYNVRTCSPLKPLGRVADWPIIAKYYVKPPWEGRTKVNINGPGHITKMAAMLNTANTFNFKNLLSRPRSPMTLKYGIGDSSFSKFNQMMTLY